jgi:hypothetical protein
LSLLARLVSHFGGPVDPSPPNRKEVAIMDRSSPLALAVAVLAWFATGGWAQTQAASPYPPNYPAMAPLEQYLTPNRADEIAQARHAAPASISNDADVLVLGRRGYETAVKGGNGFVCLVQRSWFSGLTDKEFWNPRERAPICFNPQGARSVLPAFLERTTWVLAGASKDEIINRTKAAISGHAISPPEIGAMTYMLAKDAYHSDAVAGPWHPHLMFFVPRVSVGDWGANLPGSPIMGSESSIEPFTVFFVPVNYWSDGTPDARPIAPEPHHGVAPDS